MRVAVYYIDNPWPPQCGSHQRCLQLILGLAQQGAEVHLLSPTHHGSSRWNDASVRALRVQGIKEVRLFHHTTAHRLFQRVQLKLRRIRGVEPKFGEGIFCSWWMRRWFERQLQRIDPDVILINYSFADQLLNHWAHAHRLRLLEMHDLISLNSKFRERISNDLERFAATGQPGGLFDCQMSWAAELEPDHEELEIYDRYDAVLAISQTEQEYLQPRLRHARPVFLPMQVPLANTENASAGPALFLASDNPFNRQGLLFFTNKILPLVLRECPDFRLDIAGNLPAALAPQEAVRHVGFVSDLEALFARAAFFVCPVFAGTGQQVKIVEAMSHGLATIVLARAARGGLLEHGVNGFIADSPEQFAACVCALWRDRELRTRFGAAARSAVGRFNEAQSSVYEQVCHLLEARSRDFAIA